VEWLGCYLLAKKVVQAVGNGTDLGGKGRCLVPDGFREGNSGQGPKRKHNSKKEPTNKEVKAHFYAGDDPPPIRRHVRRRKHRNGWKTSSAVKICVMKKTPLLLAAGGPEGHSPVEKENR